MCMREVTLIDAVAPAAGARNKPREGDRPEKCTTVVEYKNITNGKRHASMDRPSGLRHPASINGVVHGL